MICRIYDVPGATIEQQAANLPQPTISEFKVHKLDWCG